MNLFTKNLSANNKDIREKRAVQVAKDTALEVTALVTRLQRELNQLQNKEGQLTDLAPDNSYSLKPAGTDYSPEKWVAAIHAIRISIALKKEELSIAEEIQQEFFSELPDEAAAE